MLVVKYYSFSQPFSIKEVHALASQDGLGVVIGKPEFTAWYCLKMRGPDRLIRAALERLKRRGLRFERRRPTGAVECCDPELPGAKGGGA